jgi:hypothetical protein
VYTSGVVYAGRQQVQRIEADHQHLCMQRTMYRLLCAEEHVLLCGHGLFEARSGHRAPCMPMRPHKVQLPVQHASMPSGHRAPCMPMRPHKVQLPVQHASMHAATLFCVSCIMVQSSASLAVYPACYGVRFYCTYYVYRRCLRRMVSALIINKQIP